MALNSKKDKVIAAMVLVSVVGLLIYQSFTFIPGWLYHYEHESGVATITELKEVEGGGIMFYSYYNNYLEKEIANTRSINDLEYWDKLSNQETYSITYSKYFPTVVIFSSLDKEPLLIMRIMVYLIELLVVWLLVRVLKDKMSMAALAGVNQENTLEEE